jgi:nitrite reductase/ring-hydroxylating ferredoxin subunit
MSETWLPIVKAAEFPSDGKMTTILHGWHILLVKEDDVFYALNDRCTHAASPLSTGRVRRGSVMCPLHGARFEIATGRCLSTAYNNIRTFAVRLRDDGMIEINVPTAVPSMDDLPVTLC